MPLERARRGPDDPATQPRHIVTVEFDVTAVRIDQAGDHVENRGLASAVWTEQANRFAAPHVERHAANHHAAAETFFHPVRSKIGRTRSLPTVAATPLLRGAMRLFAAVCPLQRARLCDSRRLVVAPALRQE